MNINIDGVSVNSNSFILEYKVGDNSTCGSIDITYFPLEAVLLFQNYIYLKIFSILEKF
jgi:hypothetical protein